MNRGKSVLLLLKKSQGIHPTMVHLKAHDYFKCFELGMPGFLVCWLLVFTSKII